MSIGKKNNPVGTNFVAPTNSLFDGGLTEAERIRLGLLPTTTSAFPNTTNITPVNKEVPVVKPVSTPATNIPKISKFGNALAKMGGMKSEDIIPIGKDGVMKYGNMNQEDLDKYMATRKSARGRGMSDFLMALGSAFKGEDIMKNVQAQRNQRTLESEQARVLDINKQMAEAYQNGDYDKLNALALQMGDKTMTQAIANKINKEKNKFSADGTIEYIYDEKGNIIDAIPNMDVIEANRNTALGTADANRVLDDTVKSRTISSKMESIDGFLKNIEDGELKFGLIDGALNTMAEKGIGVTDQEAINSREFKNFRNGLVTDLLNLQTGTKTDFDWESLSDELQAVQTTEGVKDWLLKYQEKLEKEKQAIEDERSLYLDIQGKKNPFRTKPTEFPDVKAD